VPFHRTDVLHTSHGNVLAQTPWLVAVDRGRSALVVSVRGTLSIDDAITDALATPKCVGDELAPTLRHLAALGIDVPPDAAFVHAGMWAAASAIRESLTRQGLLEAAQARSRPSEVVQASPLNGAGHISSGAWLGGQIAGGDTEATSVRATSAEPLTDATVGLPKDKSAATPEEAGIVTGGLPETLPTCSDPLARGVRSLRLVVIGHSLGAGVAALLALQVRGSGSARLDFLRTCNC